MMMTEDGVCPSSDEEVVDVPPFVPSITTNEITTLLPKKEPFVEISFSDLTKESCMRLKHALLKWAERNDDFSPEQEMTIVRIGPNRYSLQQVETQDSHQDEVRLSGKFRLESNPGEVSRIIYIPPSKALLKDSELRDSWTLNKTVEKHLDAPLYERSLPQLPKLQNEDHNKEMMRPVFNHKCFSCGSYHHQVRNCPRNKSTQEHSYRAVSEIDNGEPSSAYGSRGRGRSSRGRSVRSRPGRSTSIEEPARYMNRPLDFTNVHQRKRSRSHDLETGIRTDDSSESKIPLIKILSDSESEGEGLEEGEYVETKKQKTEEMQGPDNEIEEGEIVPLSSPVPAPPPPRQLASVTIQKNKGATQHPFGALLSSPPQPQIARITSQTSCLQLQNIQNRGGAPHPPQWQQHQSATLIYVQQPVVRGRVSQVMTPRPSTVPQTAQVCRISGPGTIVVTNDGRSGIPLQANTVFHQSATVLRPVVASGRPNTATGSIVVSRERNPSASSMVLLDKNGNPLIIRPRPR